MTGDELERAMAALGVHWPHKTWTADQLEEWQATFEPFDLEDARGVLRDFAAGDFRRYAPDPSRVYDVLRGQARRRARQVAEERGTDGAEGTAVGRQEALDQVARCRALLKGAL